MDANFFSANRQRLTSSLNGGLIILSGYGLVQRSNDASFKFEQEANFWYLSGIDEPDWLLVIDGASDQTWLIMPDIDQVHRVFEGGMSADQARSISGVRKVIDADDGMSLIRQLSKKHPLVYSIGTPPYADHFNFSLNPAVSRHWAMLERTFKQVQDCRKELASLRAVKQQAEIKMIQKAVDVTIRSFQGIHERFSGYKNEYEIEADFARDIRFAGADGCAYDSIVAAGLNACTLHYDKNIAPLKPRQLILMEMGAKYKSYAADITRTYAKGEATKRQRQVHSVVEAAHKQICLLIKPHQSVEEYQSDVDAIMRNAISSLGLGSSDESLRRYFPHAVSHGLGIDVHDSLGAPKFFQEGMVLTVEPGIYIPEESIGVRIEDDILVTSKGSRNLSASLSTGL